MHLQVKLGHAQLGHGVKARHEETALLQLHQHIGRHGLIRLPVAGIGHHALRNPHPVLIHLAGQLHKIAGHAGAGVGVKLHIAQHAVQRMPELMEQRQHIQVREKSRLAGGGRLQVAHQHAEMRRTHPIHHGIMAHAHHPGAIALSAAGVQVHVDRAHVAACGLIMHRIQLHLRVPYLSLALSQLLAGLQAAGGHL